MGTPRKIQSICPKCRAWRSIPVRSQIAQAAGARTGTWTGAWTGASAAAWPKLRRQFSSTCTLRKQPDDEDVRDDRLETDGDHVEILVRQARQTFGNTLPKDYLGVEEAKLYERLFGAPLRETRPEDVGITASIRADGRDGSRKKTVIRQNLHGELEEMDHDLSQKADARSSADESTEQAAGESVRQEEHVGQEIATSREATTAERPELFNEEQIIYLNVKANNQREYDALLRLQHDFELSSERAMEEGRKKAARKRESQARTEEKEDEDKAAEEEEDEEENEKEDEEEDEDEEYGEDEGDSQQSQGGRVHAHTMLGRFSTSPTTLFLPRLDLIDPITSLLRRTDKTHIRQTAERLFGGPGLPYSPATPASMKHLAQKPVMMEASNKRMSEIEADTYLATVIPGVYASVMSTLAETRKRLGPDWLQGLLTGDGGTGPRVLDVGGGGAALSAWQKLVQAEWDTMLEAGKVQGEQVKGRKTVVVGSDHLRHRISRFLTDTTFLPRLPDYLHSVRGRERQLDSADALAPRKTYHVILASHLLMPLVGYRRKSLIDNLWEMLEPDGGVLIVVEKGHPRGFEAVADVRARMLHEFIVPPTASDPASFIPDPLAERVREPGMIVAPCTNHGSCPMYLSPGLSAGRKDYCHFSQRFVRPPFLQHLLGASHRNHEDIKYSFVSIRRGPAPASVIPASFLHGREATELAFAGYEHGTQASERPNPLSLPRNMLPPLKRRGHVTLDLCTPAGAIERWTIPRSFSKQAFHDARKTRWGDLWALGAKTRTRRNVRLGRGVDASVPVPNDGGVRARRAAEGGKRSRPTIVNVSVDPRRGVVGAHEKLPGGRMPIERRTKGGRRVKIQDLMTEMGADDLSREEEELEAEEDRLELELGEDDKRAMEEALGKLGGTDPTGSAGEKA